MDAIELGKKAIHPFSDGHNQPELYGITLREHFAGMAMQGLLSGALEESDYSPKLTAEVAVLHADALLAELAKTAE